jgi:hypothetical protein
MILEFAFFADTVEREADSQFSVTGGGRTIMRASAFPYTSPPLVLLYRIRFDEHEYGQTYPATLLFLDQDRIILSRTDTTFTVPHAAEAHRIMTFERPMQHASFATPGLYTVVIMVDDHHLIELYLDVVQADGPSQ